MKAVTKILGIALLGLAMFSGSAAAESHSSHNKAGIKVMDAWVRAVPPTSKMSAAYMIIHNNTEKENQLISAETDVAKSVELHNVRKKGEMMEMYQVESIAVPAKSNAKLEPGSYHVMLIGLNGALKVGDEVELTLNFEHGPAVTIKAPVKEGGAMPMKKMQH